MEKIRVLLADDHTIVRQGLRLLLENEHDIEIVGEASSGTEAVNLAEALSPSVIVMDITMPELNGIHATSRIMKTQPNAKVIVLSMSSDEEFVNQAIEAGVSGYLVKQTAASELISAIRSVDSGNAYLSPLISRLVLDGRRRQAQDPRELTLREKEILELIAEGKTTKDIGELLSVSIKTVAKHRQQIMDKLCLHDVASLTKYAISRGIVKL